MTDIDYLHDEPAMLQGIYLTWGLTAHRDCLSCIFFHPWRPRPCTILRALTPPDREHCDARIAGDGTTEDLAIHLRWTRTAQNTHNGGGTQ